MIVHSLHSVRQWGVHPLWTAEDASRCPVEQAEETKAQTSVQREGFGHLLGLLVVCVGGSVGQNNFSGKKKIGLRKNFCELLASAFDGFLKYKNNGVEPGGGTFGGQEECQRHVAWCRVCVH
jgi:hypothetical protein